MFLSSVAFSYFISMSGISPVGSSSCYGLFIGYVQGSLVLRQCANFLRLVSAVATDVSPNISTKEFKIHDNNNCDNEYDNLKYDSVHDMHSDRILPRKKFCSRTPGITLT